MTLAPGRVGESPNRVGGIGRVTGAQRYLADLHVADALHAALVTLEVARARLGEIDTSDALALPGVHLVLTAADLPQPVPRFGPQREDRPVLATGEVHYHGEPVALVVAETRDLAQRAAALVRVDHEPLPAVVTVADALAPDAPLVQDPSLRPDDPLAGTNVLAEHRVGWGDIDAEAARAALVVEASYRFPMVTQFAIEPHAFMAAPDDDGLLVWSTIQHPNWLQRVIAGMVGMPLSRVRVIAPDPGGGFGGKQHAKYEPAVVFAALRLGRPVRLVLSLEETFQAVRRAACETNVRIGFDAEGRILFEDIAADYLIGAYTDIADRVVGKGSYPGAGPYNVPAVRILARSVLSHTVPSTAFRGFGNPQVNWAVESTLDEGARRLGIDRLELRLRNLAARGDRFIPFDTPCDGDWAQAVRLAAERAGWGEPLPDGHGRGIAVGIKSGPTTGLSYAIVRLLVDGSVVVYAGTSDMGQGARTVLAQVAAHELGAPLEWVTVVMGDTAIVPYDQQTSASRSTVLMGNAVLSACRSIQGQLAAMAARLHGVDAADDHGHRRRRPPARRYGAHAHRDPQARARAAGWRAHRRRRVAQGRRTGSSARRRACVLRVQLHGHRGARRRGDRRRDDRPPRDRERRGQGDQPAPGPDAGRGRRDHGPRPHAHGAVPVRWRGPDPEPRRDRLPDPDQHGPADEPRERGDRERGRARAVRREGDERGRAARRRAGGRGGGP